MSTVYVNVYEKRVADIVLSRLVQYLMEVNIFTPVITVVLRELYIEFFRQGFKIEFLNASKGIKHKEFGLCFCKCGLPSKAFVFSFKNKGFKCCHSLASLMIVRDEFLTLKLYICVSFIFSCPKKRGRHTPKGCNYLAVLAMGDMGGVYLNNF